MHAFLFVFSRGMTGIRMGQGEPRYDRQDNRRRRSLRHPGRYE